MLSFSCFFLMGCNTNVQYESVLNFGSTANNTEQAETYYFIFIAGNKHNKNLRMHKSRGGGVARGGARAQECAFTINLIFFSVNYLGILNGDFLIYTICLLPIVNLVCTKKNNLFPGNINLEPNTSYFFM